MISLTTAKLLLFIALCFGPQYNDKNHAVEIVNKDAYCVWSQHSDGWDLTLLGTAANHWPTGTNISETEFDRFGKVNSRIAHAISRHDWKSHSALYFENGTVIEKQGNTVFYTINAGAPNQQVFTMMTLQNGKVL